jgi:hypothetical protein
VIAANILYVKPMMLHKFLSIPERKQIQTGADMQGKNINQASEGEILTFDASENSYDNERNPFIWPGELDIKEEIKIEVKPVKVPRLGMIVVGPRDRYAYLDCRITRVGDVYNEHQIDSIEPNSVIISGSYGRIQLSTSPYSYEAPHAVVLERRSIQEIIEPVMDNEEEGGKKRLEECPGQVAISSRKTS